MNDTPEKTYFSISEVSEVTGVKAHVLRYWESQFSMLRPRKSRGGMRMYRAKDVALVRRIKYLLYDRGFTIAGARKQLREDRRAGKVLDEPGGGGPGAGAAVRENGRGDGGRDAGAAGLEEDRLQDGGDGRGDAKTATTGSPGGAPHLPFSEPGAASAATGGSRTSAGGSRTGAGGSRTGAGGSSGGAGLTVHASAGAGSASQLLEEIRTEIESLRAKLARPPASPEDDRSTPGSRF